MKEGQSEGRIAQEIEEETAKIPSDVFLWSAATLMGLSLTLKCFKQHKLALFLGQWPAPILLMGVYNKIVKTQGSD